MKEGTGSPARKVLTVLGVLVALAVGGFLVWSTALYRQSGVEKEGIVTCPEGQECYIAQHIHAEIELTRCGAEVAIPKEAGALSGPHTHKEPNLIHSPHSALPLDPATKEVKDPEPLTVGGFLKAVEIDTANPCLGKSKAEVSLSVNSAVKPEGLLYRWADDDQIKVEIK